MEALILAMIIAYAVKKAAERSHDHWQGAKAANRKASKGKPVRQRAKSAAGHDTAYWAEQVRGGFPQVRHGLYMGWNAGRVAQLEGWQARAHARADHADLRARVTEAVREQRRRQEEALERIREAARQDEPAAPAEMPPEPGPRYPVFGPPPEPPASLPAPPDGGTTSTEGNTMSGDTTYTQQMQELQAMRRDAEEAAADAARKRMTSRLDILQSMGLDKESLADAAEIDDALNDLEKAAQKLLEAIDAAIDGLEKRHGGIKEAVDDSPVDKPADPEFYQD